MLSKLEAVCSAIATKEGWFAPLPNLPRTNNNPGDLRASPLNRIKDKHGFVQFTKPEEGIAALYQQVLRFAMMGFTVRQLINTWAPPTGTDGGNNTTLYIQQVCDWAQVTPDTVLWDLLPCENMYKK
jgi:hypothetical protein